ncbi:uncharacterized protein CLUP02_03943 [Colletotrichum lupini]|uniref:Uncharacterized protein n=1 Tax=Colletotrichum lupini TaxID=145971 RepID=A0A9Q8SJE5_9PEZI|nr:uncharacterized protein CLUP02_03943 [Colletotrichum lupini]UQC78466.1 hypothetical protein CLUP02_03943 [Colletotrichum lupini]
MRLFGLQSWLRALFHFIVPMPMTRGMPSQRPLSPTLDYLLRDGETRRYVQSDSVSPFALGDFFRNKTSVSVIAEELHANLRQYQNFMWRHKTSARFFLGSFFFHIPRTFRLFRADLQLFAGPAPVCLSVCKAVCDSVALCLEEAGAKLFLVCSDPSSLSFNMDRAGSIQYVPQSSHQEAMRTDHTDDTEYTYSLQLLTGQPRCWILRCRWESRNQGDSLVCSPKFRGRREERTSLQANRWKAKKTMIRIASIDGCVLACSGSRQGVVEKTEAGHHNPKVRNALFSIAEHVLCKWLRPKSAQPALQRSKGQTGGQDESEQRAVGMPDSRDPGRATPRFPSLPHVLWQPKQLVSHSRHRPKLAAAAPSMPVMILALALVCCIRNPPATIAIYLWSISSLSPLIHPKHCVDSHPVIRYRNKPSRRISWRRKVVKGCLRRSGLGSKGQPGLLIAGPAWKP